MRFDVNRPLALAVKVINHLGEIRRLMRDIENLLQLPFEIAPTESGHHPISRGQSPKFYKPESLLDTGTSNTPWVSRFEEYFVALYWVLGCPVPYAFRTSTGTIRSLDAGCLKWLTNRQPPEVQIFCDVDGYIGAAQPLEPLIERHVPNRETLVPKLILPRRSTAVE